MNQPTEIAGERNRAPPARTLGLVHRRGGAGAGIGSNQQNYRARPVWASARVGPSCRVGFTWNTFRIMARRGAFWPDKKWLLILFSVVVTICVIISACEVSRKGRVAAVGFGWILGGALGNLVDRVVYGYVTDFFDLDTPVGWLQNFPVFNVADSALTAGVILMLITLFRFSRRR